MTEHSGQIWLTRNNRFEWVRYVTATGRVLETFRPEGTRPTAGLIQRCRGKLVAFYIDSERTGFVLQSGSNAIAVEDETSVKYRKTHRNYFAHLTVETRQQRIDLHEITFATAADTQSDYVSSKDFLGTVYDILTRRDRREHALRVWTPTADPKAPNQ